MNTPAPSGASKKQVLTSKGVSAERERVVRRKKRRIAIFTLTQFRVAVTHLSPMKIER